MAALTSTPSRNDDVTILCPVCQVRRFVPIGRKRVCSPACRQAAFRRHHSATADPLVVPPHHSRRDRTIYQCPSCDARYLGLQRCSECGVFCRRLGAGGLCPECGEPVAVADLLDGVGDSA
jgi:rubrerythrin